MLLRLLNLVAPLYFLCLLSVTFFLQLFLFLPGICERPPASLTLSALLHSSFFLFFLVNVLGNYILVIWNTPRDPRPCPATKSKLEWKRRAALTSKQFCRLCGRVIWEQEHHCFFTGNCIGKSNMRNFVLFCLYSCCSCFHAMVAGVGYISENFSVSFSDPLTYFRLLPLSIRRFFSGSLPSSHMLVVLMLYLWCGVGLACAAFSCHQLLLITGGPSCHRRDSAESDVMTWRDNLQRVFGKRWLLGILLPVLNTDLPRPKDQ